MAEVELAREKVMSALRRLPSGSDPEFDVFTQSSLRMAFERHVRPYGLTPITGIDLANVTAHG